VNRKTFTKIAFVIGNGVSRKGVDINELKKYGKVYGCNAIYREYIVDYLVAVDVKMVLEINKAGYQKHNLTYTNPNKAFSAINHLQYFNPSMGWSSGPTALWLATTHNYSEIYIFGFDYKGLNNGKNLNNIYADTVNYKKSTDGAIFFGNWLRQTIATIQKNPNTQFIRIIDKDTYIPLEFEKLPNIKHLDIETFKKIFNIS